MLFFICVSILFFVQKKKPNTIPILRVCPSLCQGSISRELAWIGKDSRPSKLCMVYKTNPSKTKDDRMSLYESTWITSFCHILLIFFYQNPTTLTIFFHFTFCFFFFDITQIVSNRLYSTVTLTQNQTLNPHNRSANTI